MTKPNIPLFKVAMSPEAGPAVTRVLESGFTGEGPECAAFESELQAAFDSPTKPLLTNSCTSALDLAYHLLDLKPGQEAITSPMSCFASFVGLLHRNVKIVWADVDSHTGNIDPKDVAKKVNKNTKAIIAIDWAGHACDYDALKQFDVPVIEDAAHAVLSNYNGKSIARSGGDMVCYSFQSIKHLSQGDGGALIVPDDSIRDRARLLRWYGLDRESKADFRCSQDIKQAGFKFQSNDVLASIGRANLKRLPGIVQAHRDNAAFYNKAFEKLHQVVRPKFDEGSSWWLYTILTLDRDKFIEFMADRGIAASPVHRRCDEHTCMSQFKTKLPNLDIFSSTEVSIPVGWWLSEEDRNRVVDAVTEWSRRITV